MSEIQEAGRVRADFVPLNIRSHYSFLSKEAAVSSPQKLVEVLSRQYSHAALADRTLFAEGRLFQHTELQGMAALPALRVSLQAHFGYPQEAILLPRNNAGLRRLHKLHSDENLEGKKISPTDIHDNQNIYAILTGPLSPFSAILLFEPHVFRGITTPTEEIAANAKLAQAIQAKKKVVVAPEVRMAEIPDADKLRFLSSITGERLSFNIAEYAIPDKEKVVNDYEHVLDGVGLAHEIASSIHIDKPLPPEIRPASVKAGWTPEAYLRLIATRLTNTPEYTHVRERVAQEVQAMTDERREGFASALFIVGEVIEFCRNNRIPIKTTGSANNSVLLSLLGITQLTPDEANECDFDRFLNEARFGRPDIDMEVGYKDREQILAFLRNTYGLTATEIAVPHTMGIDTIERLAREHHGLLSPEVKAALAADGIPFKVQPHSSKVALVDTVPFTQTRGGSREKGKLVAELDRIDVEKIFDYVAMDFLPRQGPQRLHVAEALARRRKIVIPNIEHDRHVLDRIMSADTMGISDVESPHMQQTLTRMKYLFTNPDRQTIADAISLSKTRSEIRERYYETARQQQGILPGDVVKKLGLSGPIIFQQEDLARVARAAGFSLEKQERVRKMLSDRDVQVQEKSQLIHEITQGLAASGFDERTRRELATQMESYVGYVLVRGHALSLAHGAEELARYAVYDPLGYWTAVMTTVGEYPMQSDYTFQGYVNAAIRHHVYFDYATSSDKIPDIPVIWGNKIAVSKSLLTATTQRHELPSDFKERYTLWKRAYTDWKKGEGKTRQLAEMEWALFGSCFTTNAINMFDEEKRINPQREKQHVIIQPIAYRHLVSDTGNIYLVTLDSGDVYRAVMPASVGNSDMLGHPFLEVDLMQNARRPREWHITRIIGTPL